MREYIAKVVEDRYGKGGYYMYRFTRYRTGVGYDKVRVEWWYNFELTDDYDIRFFEDTCDPYDKVDRTRLDKLMGPELATALERTILTESDLAQQNLHQRNGSSSA